LPPGGEFGIFSLVFSWQESGHDFLLVCGKLINRKNMGFQNIENKSVSYTLLKFWAQWWHNKIFYRKVIVVNPENIPENGHLIFTPNHQNALMDALGPLFTIPRLLVFLARADIFRKPRVAKILYFLKILPVFRIRDGYDSLKKNDAIFQKTVDVINSGDGLVILPEGYHVGLHKLRPLKKGFARIAFKAEEENDFSMNIRIVPIGLYYSDYESFRSILLVNFGKSIAVSDYFELYRNNPAIGIGQLKDDLHEAIKPLMINIESENYYSLYNQLRQYRASQIKLEKKSEIQQFYAQQEIINKLKGIEQKFPAKMNDLNELVNNLENALNASKLDYEIIGKGAPNFMNLVFNFLFIFLGFPFFIYGYLNNFIPWQASVSIAGKVKDPQFRSSIKYLLSLFLFPIFYILQTSIMFLFSEENWIPFFYFLSLPLSAMFSWFYFQYYKKVGKRWMYYRLKHFKSNKYNILIDLYDKVTSEISTLLSA
jgi:1-acyl-sn-glycerol-3-phosphate acyltransferase